MFSLSGWTVWQCVDTDVVVVQRSLRRWHIRQHVGCDFIELRRLVLTGLLLPVWIDIADRCRVQHWAVQQWRCGRVQPL